MTQILLLTVGGSPAPLVNCIARIQPDRVVFLCSEGSVDSVQEILQAVPVAAFDREQDVVVLQQRLSRHQGDEICNELDCLDRVYLQARDLLERLRRQHPAARLIADYTGGTKTMAAGLAMAAVDDGDVELLLTTNERREPGQIAIQGHSTPITVAQGRVHARRLRATELPPLLKRFDYAAAAAAVTRVRRLGLPPAEAAALIQLETLLLAFEAWDRFDHLKALNLIQQNCVDAGIRQHLLALKRAIGSRKLVDREAEHQNWPSISGHGLELVEDLLLNAERRATQQRYDDAVGRLYRAMELAAQLVLKRSFRMETGAVVIDSLPEPLRAVYRERHGHFDGEGSLRLGLAASYDLLADLNHPLGLRWRQQRDQLIDQLLYRNNSLFAHGFQPVSHGGWQELKQSLGAFLKAAIDAERGNNTASLPLEQFPSLLEMMIQ